MRVWNLGEGVSGCLIKGRNCYYTCVNSSPTRHISSRKVFNVQTAYPGWIPKPGGQGALIPRPQGWREARGSLAAQGAASENSVQEVLVSPRSMHFPNPDQGNRQHDQGFPDLFYSQSGSWKQFPKCMGNPAQCGL